MESTTVSQPGTVALEPPSTVLNPQAVSQTSGGGAPNLTEPKDGADKPQSIQDVLSAESKRLREADAEAEAKVKPKAEDAAAAAKDKADAELKAKDAEKVAQPKDEKGRFAKADEAQAKEGAPEKAAAERAAPDDRQSEGRKHAEPPARFLPDARTKWANVPSEVKAEVHRLSQEYEGEIQKSKASVDRYETIREYDERAKSNGRELKDSLAKVVEVEQALARNPIAGLEAVLREIGPRKADGSSITLMEIAQHIVRNPQEYETATRQPAQMAQQQQSQPNREVEELRNEIHMMKAEQTIVPIVTRFAEAHSDYHSLEPKIIEILNSGVLDKLYGNGLSPEQKLAEAHRMAGGTPSSRSDAPQGLQQHSDAETVRPVNPDAGKKSVRGAPTDGADTTADEPSTDIRELLRKEMRKISA